MLNQSSCQGIQEGKFLQVNKHKTVNMTDVIPLPKKQKQEMAQIVQKSKKRQNRTGKKKTKELSKSKERSTTKGA